jgi:hypothetical protein
MNNGERFCSFLIIVNVSFTFHYYIHLLFKEQFGRNLIFIYHFHRFLQINESVSQSCYKLEFSSMIDMPTRSFSQTVIGLYFIFLCLSVLGWWYKAIDAVNLTAATVFQLLFLLRYYRLLVGIFFFLKARPIQILQKATITHNDVTVIIPVASPCSPNLGECITSICANRPRQIFVVAADHQTLKDTANILEYVDLQGISVGTFNANVANKRHQVAMMIDQVATPITVSADDSVIWPLEFLRSALVPFEDSNIAIVGTTKTVRRIPQKTWIDDFYNFLGCLYLERHNFDLLSTTRIDGGAFVISGRTALYRTSMIADPLFLKKFTNERFFFNFFGPLNADDDNFITRWAITHGWSVAIQMGQDATIETTLGDRSKFLSQCLR